MARPHRLAVWFAALVVFAPACAPDGEAAASAPDSVAVDVADFRFDPAPIRVAVGGRVTWTNRDPFAHTATAPDASFDSGSLAEGDEFEHTFTDKGTHAYFCSIHNYMQATVVVG